MEAKMPEPGQPVITDQNPSTIPGDTKPDLSNFVPKGQYTELTKEKAELEARFRALKEDREQLKQRTLDTEAWDEYQAWQKDRQARAENRKKEAGKYDELLKEREQEYNSILEQERRRYEDALAKEKQEREQLETKFKHSTLEGYVKGLLKEVAADDVVDIVARELIQGYSTTMRIDLDEEGNPVVLDRSTNNPAWSVESGGRVSVKDYVHAFVDKRPSFKKANVSLGSDSGEARSQSPDLSGSGRTTQPGKSTSASDDRGVPIGISKSARGLSYIRDALDERSQGLTGGFQGFSFKGGKTLLG